jgi:hypothetical protein
MPSRSPVCSFCLRGREEDDAFDNGKVFDYFVKYLLVNTGLLKLTVGSLPGVIICSIIVGIPSKHR